MKKMLVTAAATLVLSASVAMAATPAAPVMSMTVKTTKVATGEISVPDGRQLVVDGNNVYVAFTASDGTPCISRSTDGGSTWRDPAVMSTDTTNSRIRIAKAKDPLQTGKSIIVAAWGATDGLKYSYFVERPNTAGWSIPVAIADSLTADATTMKVGAAPNGSVHLFFNDADGFKYVTATKAESAFTTPILLPFATDSNWYGIGFDSSNNVYVVDTLNGSLNLHKKTAANSTWTNSTVIGSNVDTTAASIAVYDANNIYIAYKAVDAVINPPADLYANLTIWVAITNDGGKTWSKRPVTPNATVYGTYPSINVNSSKVITVVGHYGSWSATDRITINKSSDNGATWSPNVSVPGNTTNQSTLDSAGKVCVLSSINGSAELDPNFFAGTVTGPTWWNNVPIYFTREK